MLGPKTNALWLEACHCLKVCRITVILKHLEGSVDFLDTSKPSLSLSQIIFHQASSLCKEKTKQTNQPTKKVKAAERSERGKSKPWIVSKERQTQSAFHTHKNSGEPGAPGHRRNYATAKAAISVCSSCRPWWQPVTQNRRETHSKLKPIPN